MLSPMVTLRRSDGEFVVFGRFLWLIVGVGGISLAALLAFGLGNSRADSGYVQEALVVGLLVAGPLACAMSSRMCTSTVDRAFVIVNVLTVERCTVDVIARVSSDSGLVVDLYSGTDLHSTAYSSSLFSGLFGDKQATRVAARLTAEIERVTPSDAPALIRRRTPRWPCVFIVLGSGVGSAAIALIEHALRA